MTVSVRPEPQWRRIQLPCPDHSRTRWPGATVCPVALDTAVALASPANTVAGILAVAQADRQALGGRTAISLRP